MKKTVPILFIALLLITCGKTYDDGPHFTFRSAKNRIIGIWKVDKFYIDGIDSTDEFNAKLGCEFEFTKEGYTPGDKITWKILFKNCINDKILAGLWEFSPKDDKSKLRISFNEDSSFTCAIGPFGQMRDGHWTILKLTNKEFNLTTDYWDFDFGFGMRTFLLNLKK